MKEWIVGRNPVYETLSAGRRRAVRLLVAEGVQEKGRLTDILEAAKRKNLPVERAPRSGFRTPGCGRRSTLSSGCPN
jgi:hypothetical protein